ncbi:hypothetical protein PACTADRAFT_42607 [Pachysolen tannophilus NRRL Y-2460]|uniref:Protein arginine methyltransferase NDUFAF7 n=1 Tax=Pachysolen tannophilus NRRL Y-2460 TaxID=669874 RepID=A0A1E4TUE6_PACTA|nr:hypothetical protein PACTADRAFT_42607 [Pachysolen tannophilus NRRL Y-2460]
MKRAFASDSIPLNVNAQRPKNVKMTTGDFIEDSLYNPSYGYFSKEVEIYHPAKPLDYSDLKDQDEFMTSWLKSYEKYDNFGNNNNNNNNNKDNKNDSKKDGGPGLQLWHTPSELFQPYYGEALARYLLVNYMLNQYPYKDLIIYEAGAGNGTLMLNIMDYIKRNQPDVYERTRYKIIEISSKLATSQRAQLDSKISQHSDKVEIINKSIFEWEEVVPEPCFFIALEVFDNFAHDVVRYDIDSGRPYQGYVAISEHGDFQEFYNPELDEWTSAFLGLREQGKFSVFRDKEKSFLGKQFKNQGIFFNRNSQRRHPIYESKMINHLKNILNPLRSNLSAPEYIPTRLLKFFHILKYKFPEHQLLASDFSSLPEVIQGYNAPTVQTFLNNRVVNVSTYMVLQGYFDIIFPTDFKFTSDLYRQVIGKVSKTATHTAFLEQWADIEATTTRNGDNPMLDFYKNAAFLYS